ncbi:hypothetical protein IFR05_012625 [Cadophora sp. M221]|nr:hypothetical protein IFR05_012625 [Cadophora sp. M221]
MTKSAFVAAATGEQGRPLSKLLLQLGYKVQILVRDPSSSVAQALRSLGADVHIGDLGSLEAFVKAIDSASTIYLAPTKFEGRNLVREECAGSCPA